MCLGVSDSLAVSPDRANPLGQNVCVDQLVSKERCDEREVLLPARDQLARGAVLRGEAEEGYWPGDYVRNSSR